MPHYPRGVSVPVTVGRRLVAEYMHQSRNVPTVAVSREFALGHLAAVRAATHPKVSWVALFAKAYGLAARRHAALRRSWTTFPFARLYEHDQSVCVVLVEREWGGEEVVLGGRVRGPETTSLRDLSQYVRRLQSAPVWSISCFRQILRLGRYPGLLRRFLLWSSLHWSGRKRSKRFGTFLISSLGNIGCGSISPRFPLTGYLSYGPISHDGRTTVSLTFDHRVLDGRQAARALADMESFLNTVLLAELRKTGAERPAISSVDADRVTPGHAPLAAARAG